MRNYNLRSANGLSTLSNLLFDIHRGYFTFKKVDHLPHLNNSEDTIVVMLAAQQDLKCIKGQYPFLIAIETWPL